MMDDAVIAWDGDLVRRWLESRSEAARLDQAAADKRGYETRDEYDKAAAEEWVRRALKTAGRDEDRVAFAARLKELLAQDGYRTTGFMTTDGSIGTSEPTSARSPGWPRRITASRTPRAIRVEASPREGSAISAVTGEARPASIRNMVPMRTRRPRKPLRL